MGKTKTKIIDDSLQAESADQQIRKSVKKKFSKKAAKPELVKVNGAVERTTESGVSDQESGAKQTISEVMENIEESGEPSGALRSDEPTLPKKSQKPGKSKPRSKKYQEKTEGLNRSKSYSLAEVVDMVKNLSYSKFNGTLEAHIVTAQTGLRGLISLPYASGRKIRVLAFGKNAPESGADIIGDDFILSQIEKGQINFDIIVTTPEWMPKLAKVAKILGPRSLMPNPKNGTITEDLKKAVAGFQGGKTEFKTEGKTPVIHLSLGKLDQPTEQLQANLKTLLQTLGKSRVVKVHLAPTMGPSVKLDLSSF